MRAVLIIDDAEEIRCAIRLVLENYRYEVSEACNGREGLVLLRQATRPLVVLLDLMMPVMSGVEMLQELAKEPDVAARHVFVVCSAARAFEADTLRMYLPSRPIFALPKPFDVEGLLGVIQQATWEVERSVRLAEPHALASESAAG